MSEAAKLEQAALVFAAHEYASKYDGDTRQDIAVDVLNAFFAGSKFRAPVRAPTDERGDGDYIRRLLEAAKCPSCDNSGTTRFGEECEWCFCRKRALAVPVSAQTPAGDALLWRATDADPAALTRAGGTVPISRGVTSTAPPAQPSKVVAALRKWREQQVSTNCCAVMLAEIDAALTELSREARS